MSSVDPFAPGSTVLTYRLVERVGTSTVWRAEETRSGRKVAVKVLSKQLPRDAALVAASIAAFEATQQVRIPDGGDSPWKWAGREDALRGRS